ncbi:toxin glutamine deamidase domain-containing protein [Amycolatopsis sp. NPDC051071]|uniref:toxin glutamine deamidase domain-containing protein n=1 Tax=Amycolatopsis sp. NPDC051071 TaxID=3154637 RepID=UPI00342A4EAA
MEDKGPPSGDFWNLILSEGGGTVDDYYPPDSAVHAQEKAEGFKAGANHVRQAVTRTNDVVTQLHSSAWRDRGGAGMRDLVQNNNNGENGIIQIAGGLDSLGGAYESYANLLVDIKDKIHDTYDRNHLIYLALGCNLPYVRGYYRRKLAEGVAKDIKKMISDTAHNMLHPSTPDTTPHDGFFGGLWDSAVVQLKALAGLAGYGEGGFSVYNAEQAWGNLGLLVGGAALYGLDPNLGQFVDDKLFDGVLGDTLTEFGKNFIAYDEWKTDWKHALGYTTGNVAGLLGTRGAGAGIARGARALGKGAKAADLTGFPKGLHKVGDVVSKANLTGVTKYGLGKAAHVVDDFRSSRRAEDAAPGVPHGKDSTPPPGPVEKTPNAGGSEPPNPGPPRDREPSPPNPRDGEPVRPTPAEKEGLRQGIDKKFADLAEHSPTSKAATSLGDSLHAPEPRSAPPHGGTPAEQHGATPNRHGGQDPVPQADRPPAPEPAAAEPKAPSESHRGGDRADASPSRDGLDGQTGHAQPSVDSPPHGLRDQLGPGQSGLFDKAWTESAHSGYPPRVREEFAFWRATGHVSPNIGHGLRMEIIDSMRKADVDPPPPTLSRDSVTKEDVAGGAIGRDAANMARNDLKNLGREGPAPAKVLDGLRDRGTGQPGETRAGKHGEEAPVDRRNPVHDEAGHGSKDGVGSDRDGSRDGSRGDRHGEDGGPADRVKDDELALRERRERFETPIDQFAKKHMPDEYAKRHGDDDGPIDGVGPGGGNPKQPGPVPGDGSGAAAAPRSSAVGLLEGTVPSAAHEAAPARGADRSGSTTVSPKPLPHASVAGLRDAEPHYTTGLADPARSADRVAKQEDAAGLARPEPESLKIWREERLPEGDSARLPAEPPVSPPPRPTRITPEPDAPGRQPGRAADGPAAGPLSRAADETTTTREAARTRPPAAFPSVRQPEVVPRPPDGFPATRPAEFTEPKRLDHRPTRPWDPAPSHGLPTVPVTPVPPGDFPGPVPGKPPAPDLPLHRPPQPEKPAPIELPARPEHDSPALPQTPARPGDPVAPGVARPSVPGWPEEFPLRIDRQGPPAPEIPAWPGRDDGGVDPDTDPLAEVPPEVLEQLTDTEREALRNLAAGLGWNAAQVLHRVLDEIIDRLILHPRPGEPRRMISRDADLAEKLKFLEEHEEREWLGERLAEMTGTRPEKPRTVRPERGGGGTLGPQRMPNSLGPWGFADATVREHQEIDALRRFAAYLADPVKNPLSDSERAAIREILAYRAQRVRGEDPALDALYELLLENPGWLAGAEIEGGPRPVLDERGEPTGMVEVAGRLAGLTGLRILIVPARDLREGSAARREAMDRARAWLDAAPEGVRNSAVLDGRHPAGKDPESASLSRELMDIGFDVVFQHREFQGREAKAAPYTVLDSLPHTKNSFPEKATADRPVRSPALAKALGEEAAARARQFVERHWPERALEGDLRRLDTGQLTDAMLVGAEIVHVVPANRDAHGRPTGFPWVVVRLADGGLARVMVADLRGSGDAAHQDLLRRAREDLANRPFGKRDFLVVNGPAAWNDQSGLREITRRLTEGPGRRFAGVLYRQNWEGPRTPGKDSPFTLLTPNPRLKGKLLAAPPREPMASKPENKPPEPKEITEAEWLTEFRALADVMAGMYERLAAEAGPSVASDEVFAVFKENNPELFGYLKEVGTAAAVDASRLADLLGDGVERRAWSPAARENHLDNVAIGITRGWDLTDAERALLAAMDAYAPELPAFRREFGDLLDRVRQTMPEKLEPLLRDLGDEAYSIDEKMLLAKKYFDVFLDAGNKPGSHPPDELPKQLEEAAPKVSALLEQEAALGSLSHEEVQRRTTSWAGFAGKAAELRDSIAAAERTQDVRPVLETLRALSDSLRAYAREHADSPVPGWVEVVEFDLLDPHRMRFLRPSVSGNGRFDVVTRAITRHWLEALFGAEGVDFAHRLTESAVPWDGRSIASHPMRDGILAQIGEDKLFGQLKRRAVALPELGLSLIRPEVGLGELVTTLVHESVVHGMQEPKPVNLYRGLAGEWFETLMQASHEFQGRSGELLVVEALRAGAVDSVVPRELRVDVVPRSLRVPSAEWDSFWMSRVIGIEAGRLGEAGRATLSGQLREIGFGHESDAGRIRRAVVDPRHPRIETPAVGEFKADPAAFAAKYPAPSPSLQPEMPPPPPRPDSGPADLMWPDPMVGGGPRPLDWGVPWQPGKRPRHPQRQAPHPRHGGVPTPPGLPAGLAGFWAALRAEDRRALADLAAEVGPRAGFPVLKNFTTLLARKNGFPEKTGEALAHWLAQVAPPAGLPPEWAPVWHALPTTAQRAFSELITAVGAAAATGELIDRVSGLTTHQGGILEQIADLRGHPERFGVLARQLTAAIASVPSAAPAALPAPQPAPAPAPAGPVPIEAGEPVRGKTYPEKIQQALWDAFPEAVKVAGMTIVGQDPRSITIADPRGRTIGVVLDLADLEDAAGQWSVPRRHPDHGPALGTIKIAASTRMPLEVALRVAVHGLIAGYANLTGEPTADPGARFLSPEGNLDGLPRPTAADRGYLAQLVVLARAFDSARWNLPQRFRLRKEIRDVLGKLGLDPNQANHGHRLAALAREPVTSLIKRHLPPTVTGGYPVTRTHVATGLITGFLPSGSAAVVFAAAGSPASGLAWGVFGLVNAVYSGFLAREWEIKKDAQVAEVRKYDAKAREIDAVAAPAERVRSLLEVLGWAPEEGHDVPADKQAMGPRPDLAQPLRKHGARFSVPQLTALGAGTVASVPFEIWADTGIGLASWLSLTVYAVGAAVFLPLAERARTRVQKGVELKEIDKRARGLDKAEADVYAAMGQRLGLERPPEPSEIPDPHNAHLPMPELGIMANLPDFSQYFSEILRRGLRSTASGTIDNTAMLSQHLTLFQALAAYGAGKSLLMLPIAIWQLNKLDQLELGYTVDRRAFDERDIRRLMRPDVYAERMALLEQVEKMIAPPRPGLLRRFREALPFLGQPRAEQVRSVVPGALPSETRPGFASRAEFVKTYTRVSFVSASVTVGFVEAFGVTESLAVAAMTAGLFGPVVGWRKWWHRRHELELSDKDIAETNQGKAAERVAVQMAASAFVDSQVILSAATVTAELERPGRSVERQAGPVRTVVPEFTAIRINAHDYPYGNWANAYRDALRDLRRSLGAEAVRLDPNRPRRDWGDYRTLGERRLAIVELVALAERAATYLDDHHRTGNGLPVWEANADLSNAIDRYRWLYSPEWPKELDPAPDAPRRPGDDPEVKRAEEAAVRHLQYRDPPVRRNSIDHRGGWQGSPPRAGGETHPDGDGRHVDLAPGTTGQHVLPAIHAGIPGAGKSGIERYIREHHPELPLTNPNYHAPDAYLDGYRTNCTRDVVYYVRRLRGEDVTAPPLRPADSAVLGTLEYISERLGGTWEHSHGTSYDSVISAMLDRPSGAMAVLAMEYRLAGGRVERHAALVANDEGRIVFLDPQDGWLLSLPKDPVGLDLLPFTDVELPPVGAPAGVRPPRGDLHLPEPRGAVVSPERTGYNGKDDDVSLGPAEVEAVHAREIGHVAYRETRNPAAVPREDSVLFRTTRRNALPAMHAKTVIGRWAAAASYLLSKHGQLPATNPHYYAPDALDDGYLTNCTRAVVYYVRRLRGENVTAPPVPVDRMREMSSLGYISDRLGGTWNHDHGTSYDSVIAAMMDRPAGALAVIHVTSTERGGSVRDHVALVSRDANGVVFLEPHNGWLMRLPKRVTGIGLLTFTDAELPPRGQAEILTEATSEVARRGAEEILRESVLAPRPGPIDLTGTQWAAVRAVREGIVSFPDSPPVRSVPASPEDQAWLDDFAAWLAEAAGGTAGSHSDASKDTGLASAFVTFDKVSWAYQALDVVRERLGTEQTEIVSLDDRFVRPRHDGYRDLRLTLRPPSGHLAELQLRLKAIEEVAETARALDETVGALVGREEEQTRPLSRDEEALEVTILRRQAELFDEATKRGLPSSPPPGPEAFGDAAEAAMTAAEPLDCVEFGDGRQSANATYHLTYADHPRTIYKPASGETRALGSHLPLAGQGYRENAMYRLARAVGSDAVPPTAYIDGPLGPGSSQVWRTDAGPALEVPAYPREQQQLIAFLDYVAASLDRSPSDCLTGPSGEAIVIDNGQSFPDYADPLAGIRSGFVAAWFDVPFDAEVLAAIRAIDPAWLVRMLVATGIGDEAAEGARERLEELQRLGRIAGQTWPARIWDHEWKLVREFK